MAVSADALVAGVHADLTLTSLADLGWKALAVSVSDLAAMGCRASRAVVTVAAPAAGSVEELYDGLAAAAAAFDCPIVGGDLTASPTLVVSVTVVGDAAVVPAPVTRSGARPGDEIWVSGPLGAAAAGLRALRSGGTAPRLVQAHARPAPRPDEGRAARELGATAMIDVSDGFLADLGHVLRGSGVGARIDSVPVADGASTADALSGGDDYELVWCCPPGAPIAAGFATRGLRPPVRVGTCVDDASALVVAGRPAAVGGWEHWR
ncbi:MAG: thiamine-phosphate kinase [Acidimicrobiales bacterium]